MVCSRAACFRVSTARSADHRRGSPSRPCMARSPSRLVHHRAMYATGSCRPLGFVAACFLSIHCHSAEHRRDRRPTPGTLLPGRYSRRPLQLVLSMRRTPDALQCDPRDLSDVLRGAAVMFCGAGSGYSKTRCPRAEYHRRSAQHVPGAGDGSVESWVLDWLPRRSLACFAAFPGAVLRQTGCSLKPEARSPKPCSYWSSLMPAAETATRVTYRLKADSIEACNCHHGCNCQFPGFPNEGKCEFIVGYQVTDGNVGPVSLNGVRAVVAAKYPRAIHEGNGHVVLFIDDNATQEQADAFLSILSGKLGGMPWEAIAGTIGKFEGPIRKPVEIEIA